MRRMDNFGVIVSVEPPSFVVATPFDGDVPVVLDDVPPPPDVVVGGGVARFCCPPVLNRSFGFSFGTSLLPVSMLLLLLSP